MTNQYPVDDWSRVISIIVISVISLFLLIGFYGPGLLGIPSDVPGQAGPPAPPTPQALALADRTGMTEEARVLFFEMEPAVEAVPRFAERCPGGDALGCFTGETIVIFQVIDPRLDGTMENVAAHELLHAAWSRLGDDERSELEPMIRSAFATIAERPGMPEVIDSYLKRYGVDSVDTPEMLDEMHSFVGTEVAAVDPILDAHYRRYFIDRAAVVALWQLSQRRLDQIAARLEEINFRTEELNVLIADEYASVGATVAEYNESDGRANRMVEEQNTLATEFTASSTEYKDLVDLLDSSRSPVSTPG